MLKRISVHKITLAAAIFALVAPGLARAEDGSVAREVSTRGLDLASPRGEATLQLLIQKAARSVCAEATEGFDDGNAFAECVHDSFKTAWSQAEAKIAAAKSRSLVASATSR